MSNITFTYNGLDLPPLPSYNLKPLPPLFPPIPDKLSSLLLPLIAYWGFSMFFHLLDTKDYLPQYRLHTPAEVLKRNRVSRYEVVRDVIVQQIIQTFVGYLLGLTEPDEYLGKEDFDIAIWATRIRLAQKAIPGLLSLIGVNAWGLASKLAGSHPALARAMSGGHYSVLTTAFVGDGAKVTEPAFARWELLLASFLYNYLIPAMQYLIAIVVIDAWQYFLHRAMHMNKYLYTTFHSRHHRLYVPYAYGALYNHPFEGFLLDTLGASVAYKVAGMSTRQGMWLFTGSTFKTVDDHCGYALPFDPLQRLFSNNAGYHDVHHQTWGIKTNFSQPFFVFWDRVMGTAWTGGDVSARYEKTRIAAQRQAELDVNQKDSIAHSDPAVSTKENLCPYKSDIKTATDLSSIPISAQQPAAPKGKAEFQAAGSRQQILDDQQSDGLSVLQDEAAEEQEAKIMLRRIPRKREKSSSKETLAGLRERVSGAGGMHRGAGILGVEKGR